MLYEFCESVVHFLEHKGYDTVYFIAKHEMLWITEHIQDNEISRNKILAKYSEAHQFITNEENSFSERKSIVCGKFTKHHNTPLDNYSFCEDCLSALKKISHTF
jgi:2-hydroxy-3-keto-5-methylthiopentenyl-1-phosphate phosphatase